MMKTVVLVFLMMSLVSFGLLFGEEIFAQTQPSSTQLRRTYPGGKDDSDLTVQTLRKITRKGEDVEPEDHGHEESVEEIPTPSGTPSPTATPQNFGE